MDIKRPPPLKDDEQNKARILPVLDRHIRLPNDVFGPQILRIVNEKDSHHVDTSSRQRIARGYSERSQQAIATKTFTSNVVITSRYTLWTFLPKNLFEQFQYLANIYFFFIGVLQLIPATTTTDNVPTTWIPLAFVVTVSAIRAAVEDLIRHDADKEENNRLYWVYRRSESSDTPQRQSPPPAGDLEDAKLSRAPSLVFKQVCSGEIQVGDIVLLHAGESFPADMVLLHTSHSGGHCFVETSNLDGETTLKVKMSPSEFHSPLRVYTEKEKERRPKPRMHRRPSLRLSRNYSIVSASGPAPAVKTQSYAWPVLEQLAGEFMWEAPNAQLEQFNGWLRCKLHNDKPVMLSASNLALRGTSLQNTDYVLGMVAYTGQDTKVRRNAMLEHSKVKIKSSIMRRVDRILLGMFALQMGLCVFAGIFAGVWHEINKDNWYLMFTESGAVEGVLRFFSWFIILSQLVPISLIVSSEIVKTFQAWFINRDLKMYCALTDTRAAVRSVSLNEDLGQIEYIFSDKTGTLTRNQMQFRVAVVGAVPWGSVETEISRRVALRQANKVPPRVPYTQLAAEADRQRAELAREQGLNKELAGSYVNVEEAWRVRMLDVLWGTKEQPHPQGTSVADTFYAKHLAPEVRRMRLFLLHMAISNTITPVLDAETGQVNLQASSPDELALCTFAKFMGFSLVSRKPTVVHVHKFGRGSDEEWTFTLLGLMEFSSKRKRVTAVYEFEGRIMAMMKGADNIVLSIAKQLVGQPDTEERKAQSSLSSRSPAKRNGVNGVIDSQGSSPSSISGIGPTTIDSPLPIHDDVDDATSAAAAVDPPEHKELTIESLLGVLDKLATNGLRTLAVAHADHPSSWWETWKTKFEGIQGLPERDDEQNHTKGACAPHCRICRVYEEIERGAKLRVLGATAIEDRLQELVPECIEDFLRGGMKVWMLTGDKQQTAQNIATACNLIDPGMSPREESQGPGKPVGVIAYGELLRWPQSRLLPIDASLANIHKLAEDMDFLTGVYKLLQGLVDQDTGRNFSPAHQLLLLFKYLRLPLQMEDTKAIVRRAEQEHMHSVLASASPSTPPSLFQRRSRTPPMSTSSPQAGLMSLQGLQTFLRHTRVTLHQAVESDLVRAIQVAEKIEDVNETPISMIVSGAALAVLYPVTKRPTAPQRAHSDKSLPPCQPSGASVTPSSVGLAWSRSRPTLHQTTDKLGTPTSMETSSHVELPTLPKKRMSRDDPPATVTPLHQLSVSHVSSKASSAKEYEVIGSEEEREEVLNALKTMFFDLAAISRSVVCCRLTPFQKAKIVSEVQQRTGAITLAIGDGANDEPMLRKAHVGVGISGLEGRAAVMASDYAIAQFRYLHSLLFVHGFWSYNRISTLVVYIFYKTIMLRLCMFWFGFFSGFSGQQFFSDWVGTFYNVAMTASPIIALAVLDQKLERNTLEDNPEIYRSVIGGQVFHVTYFSSWIFRAAAHALLIFFLFYFSMGLVDVGHSDGKVHGLWVLSTWMYTAVVFVATLRIVPEMSSINVVHWVFIVLSLLGSFAVIYGMTLIPQLDLFGSMAVAIRSASAWLSLLLAVVVPLMVAVGVKGLQREFWPTVTDIYQEIQLLKKSSQPQKTV